MASKHSEYDSNGLSRAGFVPGTYQIKITRMDESGKQKSLTAYVPMTKQGKAELLRRHYSGFPHKKPEYFVK